MGAAQVIVASGRNPKQAGAIGTAAARGHRARLRSTGVNCVATDLACADPSAGGSLRLSPADRGGVEGCGHAPDVDYLHGDCGTRGKCIVGTVEGGAETGRASTACGHPLHGELSSRDLDYAHRIPAALVDPACNHVLTPPKAAVGKDTRTATPWRPGRCPSSAEFNRTLLHDKQRPDQGRSAPPPRSLRARGWPSPGCWRAGGRAVTEGVRVPPQPGWPASTARRKTRRSAKPDRGVDVVIRLSPAASPAWAALRGISHRLRSPGAFPCLNARCTWPASVCFAPHPAATGNAPTRPSR